jgi:hypothetical protein
LSKSIFSLRVEQDEPPDPDNHVLTPSRETARACATHRLILEDTKCPKGCICDDESEAIDLEGENPLLWITVEVVDGKPGRTKAWVYREGVEWAQWCEDADSSEE